jgi:hypothetical protein
LPSAAEVTAMGDAMLGVSPRNLYYVIETGFVANTTVYYTTGAITTGNVDLTKIIPSGIDQAQLVSVALTLTSSTTAVPFTLNIGTAGATHTVRLYMGVSTLIKEHTGITASGNFTIGATERNIILNALPSSVSATTWLEIISSKDGNTATWDSKSVATTVTLGSEYIPIIGTITRAEANAYLLAITSSNYFLTAKSNIAFTIPATMATGTTRKSTRVQFAGTDATILGTGTSLTTEHLYKMQGH